MVSCVKALKVKKLKFGGTTSLTEGTGCGEWEATVPKQCDVVTEHCGKNSSFKGHRLNLFLQLSDSSSQNSLTIELTC